jgi:hypothetical protein
VPADDLVDRFTSTGTIEDVLRDLVVGQARALVHEPAPLRPA